MGEKKKLEIKSTTCSGEENSLGRMFDEEDLKRKVNSIWLLVFLELDVFHLCFHQCQRGRLLKDWGDWLQAWMLMIFLWGSIVDMLL